MTFPVLVYQLIVIQLGKMIILKQLPTIFASVSMKDDSEFLLTKRHGSTFLVNQHVFTCVWALHGFAFLYIFLHHPYLAFHLCFTNLQQITQNTTLKLKKTPKQHCFSFSQQKPSVKSTCLSTPPFNILLYEIS